MKYEDKVHILTYVLSIFNSIFLIVGAIILGSGIWVLWDKNSFITVLYENDNVLRIAAYCFLAIGITAIIVCLMGCIGSIKEVKCLLILYLIFLALIFIIQLAIGLALLFQQNKIEKVLDEKTLDVIKHYGNNDFPEEHTWKLLDIIQKQINCCGHYNNTDWKMNEVILSFPNLTLIPSSCTNNTITSSLFCNVTEDTYIYPEGCKTAIQDWLFNSIFIILGVAVGLLLTQVFQFILAVQLIKTIKKHVI
ncbi:CD82 antigen isoform X2 [Callorhinchus milii]|uniref:CD82 antigen isoform X2 n=1 Tax=Callorhinchus milii TaxID=7868 RepID=UPI0004573C5D|nr:CD82 antigen isoform X2 [Callorhinchus milii]|eukprot:gi/632971025/ref/XP_007901969.1/ PREDICTED: putative tetraspanin-19 isoform X2 [Callorhinchus milii]